MKKILYSRIHNDRQRKFYDSHDPEYLNFEKNKAYATYIVDHILPVISKRKQHVLEIGAGQGRFTFELSRHVKTILATDLSSLQITLLTKHARVFSIKAIKAKVLDVLEKPHQIKKFDDIVGFFVLHHLPQSEYPRIIQNLADTLKSGGRMSFIEPNSWYPGHLVEMLIMPDMSWEIEKGIYTSFIGRFIKACEAQGFTVIARKVFGFWPPPLINRFSWITRIEVWIERIPILSWVLCPFVLVSVEKVKIRGRLESTSKLSP